MHIIVLDEVDSTNNYIKEHAEIAPRTAVLALSQTAGRGRLGRSFCSPKGLGMYLSVALEASDALLSRLTPLAAVAAREAVRRAGADCGIKWVNDLVARDGRKLCGILAERRGDRAVLGVGIDLRQRGDDFPPELREVCTSVALAGGREVEPREMAEIFLTAFEAAEALSASELFSAYAAACVTLGREVVVRRTPDDKGRAARALRLRDDYALEVEYPDGAREWLISGEASVKEAAR